MEKYINEEMLSIYGDRQQRLTVGELVQCLEDGQTIKQAQEDFHKQQIIQQCSEDVKSREFIHGISTALNTCNRFKHEDTFWNIVTMSFHNSFSLTADMQIRMDAVRDHFSVSKGSLFTYLLGRGNPELEDICSPVRTALYPLD